jgi:uncharacterized protein with FMN-binding domain
MFPVGEMKAAIWARGATIAAISMTMVDGNPRPAPSPEPRPPAHSSDSAAERVLQNHPPILREQDVKASWNRHFSLTKASPAVRNLEVDSQRTLHLVERKDHIMTHTSLRRRALPLTFAALAAGSALSSQHALAATATKYKGAVTEQDRWGSIQVAITVKNKKITNVTAAVSPDNPRSTMIEARALPLLKQEVLQAQRANVDTVSGATDTSMGYITSLESAVKKAIKAKTLTAKAL